MKKIIPFLVVFCLMMGLGFAIPAPPHPTDIFKDDSSGFLSIIDQPPSPTLGDCTTFWVESGSYCSGNIRIYQQCIPKFAGAIWEQRTEDCGVYSTTSTCSNGVCSNLPNNNFPPPADGNDNISIINLQTIVIGLIVVIIGVVLYFRKK